jgi:hypothetical protein
MDRFVLVEEFDTDGSRSRRIPGEETAGGLAPALRRGEMGKRAKKVLGRSRGRPILFSRIVCYFWGFLQIYHAQMLQHL